MELNITRNTRGPIVALKGRFDFQAHQEFREAIEGLMRAGTTNLTMDLSGVDFIDSSALGMLLAAREGCEKAGGNVVLSRPQQYVEKVLDKCRFDTLFKIER